MFKRFFQTIIILVAIGGVIWYLAPKVIANAGNSLLQSANSTAQGLAQYFPSTDNPNKGNGDLQIQLSGLSPKASYDVTLDQGACGNTFKGLGSVTTDQDGNVTSVFTVPSLDTKQAWYIDVYQYGTSMACGLLETDQNSSSQLVAAGKNGPNTFGGQPNTPTPMPGTDTSNGANPDTSNNGSLPNGLAPTGADPGDGQSYDNNQYPRKY